MHPKSQAMCTSLPLLKVPLEASAAWWARQQNRTPRTCLRRKCTIWSFLRASPGAAVMATSSQMKRSHPAHSTPRARAPVEHCLRTVQILLVLHQIRLPIRVSCRNFSFLLKLIIHSSARDHVASSLADHSLPRFMVPVKL